MAETDKETDNQADEAPASVAAGTVITPDSTAASPSAPALVTAPSPAPTTLPALVTTPAVDTPAAPKPAAVTPETPPEATSPETTGFYRGDGDAEASTNTYAGGDLSHSAPDTASTPDQSVTWTASEFVAHQKSTGWYAGLAVTAAVIAALVYWITHDLISLAVIVVGSTLLGIYGGRQPRQLKYQVDWQGVTIGAKRYLYSEFRSFCLTAEGAFPGIVFMPLKRFGLPTTIYYAPDDEDRIVAIVADQLPLENEAYHDKIDSLMQRLRF